MSRAFLIFNNLPFGIWTRIKNNPRVTGFIDAENTRIFRRSIRGLDFVGAHINALYRSKCFRVETFVDKTLYRESSNSRVKNTRIKISYTFVDRGTDDKAIRKENCYLRDRIFSSVSNLKFVTPRLEIGVRKFYDGRRESMGGRYRETWGNSRQTNARNEVVGESLMEFVSARSENR